MWIGEIISFISENLSDKYKPVDILIDQNGVWHVAGIPTEPTELMHRIDVVWNTSHPSFSWTLKDLSIPSVGVSPMFHALRGSREMLREHMQKIGIHLPQHLILSAYQADLDGSVERYAFH